MGIVAAKQPFPFARSIIPRPQRSAIGRSSATPLAERCVARSVTATSSRTVYLEIFANGRNNRRLLRIKGGELSQLCKTAVFYFQIIRSCFSRQDLILLSIYSSGRDENYFPQPNEFQPERWIRTKDGCYQGVKNPYATLPFAMGVRSCIGRKLAETQMSLALAQVGQINRINSMLF